MDTGYTYVYIHDIFMDIALAVSMTMGKGLGRLI